MKIALLDAFPRLEFSAEKEFIIRCIEVFRRLGHEAREIITSDQVMGFGPDFVFVTHDIVPKMTEHFTVGPLWSPTEFYKNDRERLRAIRSWDLVLPINEETRQFAVDLHFPLRHRSAVGQHFLYPSAPVVDIALPDTERLSLAYVGVHWDGARHEELFRALAEVVDLHVYGPAAAWSFLPATYRGSIPFDGHSLIQTLNRHGAVLALHKPTHSTEDTPSMRVFEACAAKCLVITDPMASLKGIFGDSIEYVDAAANPQCTAEAIAAIMRAARSTADATAKRISTAHEIFRKTVSLEVLLTQVVEEVAQRRAGQQVIVPKSAETTISVIIRCGSRPLSLIKRAVLSLERQLYTGIAIIFARFAEIAGFDTYIHELRASGRFQDIQVVEVGGDGCRSTSLWAGMQQVKSPFFANLDDDDEWFPDHLLHTMAAFKQEPEADLFYSGGIRREEEGQLPNPHERLQRADGTFFPETRELMFFDAFDLGRLLKLDNMILSHSFVGRSNLLTGPVLDDPKLESIEDVYLYLLLVARGADIRFTGRVSVIWNWRSTSRDNFMLAITDDRKALSTEKIVRRLSDYRFPGNYLGQLVLGRGYLALAPEIVEIRQTHIAALQQLHQAIPQLQIAARQGGRPWKQRMALVVLLARVSITVAQREGLEAVFRKSLPWFVRAGRVLMRLGRMKSPNRENTHGPK
jgi:hypothetical protein